MSKIVQGLLLAGLFTALCSASSTAAAQQKSPKLESPDSRAENRMRALEREVRHELVTLPYYGVFDWLEGSVQANGTVTLRGEVVRPSTKSDAERRVRNIESVTKVVNRIKVLPLSPSDDRLRLELYRALFNWNSPLMRYAVPANPSIHIIVDNGRATLKGVVASKMDKQLAYTAARGVPGLFDVRNELQVEVSGD